MSEALGSVPAFACRGERADGPARVARWSAVVSCALAVSLLGCVGEEGGDAGLDAAAAPPDGAVGGDADRPLDASTDDAGPPDDAGGSDDGGACTGPFARVSAGVGLIGCVALDARETPTLFFDDFEDGTDGQTTSERGYRAEVNDAVVTTNRAHSGNASVRAEYPATVRGAPAERFFEVHPPIAPTDHVYAAFWSYFEQTEVATMVNWGSDVRTDFRLLKLFRAGGGELYGGRPQANDTLFFASDGSVAGHDAAMISFESVESRPPETLDGPGMGAWHFCEYDYALRASGVMPPGS